MHTQLVLACGVVDHGAFFNVLLFRLMINFDVNLD